MPKLTWTVAGATQSIDVTDSCSIGRMPGNTIALEDETGASRRHCQILKISSGFEVSDLGSTNGTKVNGQAIKRHKLKDGDEIRIGETRLVWSEGAGGGASDDVVLEGDVQLEEPAGGPSGGASAGAATSEQCYLAFAGGPRDGQKITLEKKRVTFGRNAKNAHVFADDAGVSGYHCEIAREGGAYVLRDLGSTNGTLVDGEPVTEIALQHGNRIRIGAQRLVFVDPTVSDFEKAMSAVEDLGSEWGLLRAEMDMSRVQQARRSQILAVGLVLVVLAGAGYVAVAHPEIISGKDKAPVAIPGNQIPVSDFSFEELSATWAVPPGSPGQGRFADRTADGPAKQGKGFYAVTREGSGVRGAIVSLSDKDRIRVNPNAAYSFGAWIRTKGDAQGAVRVTWFATDGTRVVGESATDLVSSSDWTEARQAVARPPADAGSARVDLVDAAGGTAFFDDVFFSQVEPRPQAPELREKDLAYTVTPDGQASLANGNVVLFSDLCAVGGAFRPDSLDGSRRTDRVGARKATSVGAPAKVSGETFDAARGQFDPYSFQATLAENRYIDLDLELGADAGLVASLPKEAVGDAVTVLTESQFFRMSDARAVEKVKSVTFGDRNRFEIAVREGASFRFALQRHGDGWQMAIGGAGPIKLRIDTDSKALRAAVDQLETAARDAEARKKLGDAIRLYRELEAKLPQGSPAASAAAEKANTLEQSARDQFAQLTKGRTAAVEFSDDVALAFLEFAANELVAGYQNHEVGTGAQAEIDLIRQAKEKRRLILDERAAAPMLARAKDYKSREDWAIARAILGGIVTAYPGTQAAEEAKRLLGEIPAGK